MKKKINDCCLVCVDCYYYGASVSALQKSMVENEFDKVLFLTDIPITLPGIEVIQIPTIRSKREYSDFVVKQLYKYIDAKYVLHVQHDGYTLDGSQFDERLYDYDWAGSLWLESDGYANGNGGYKWVSKRLLEVVGTDGTIKATHPEDAQLCRTYRDYLEVTYGLKWATDEICEGFAFELREPARKTMGFHGNFHQPYRPSIVIKRTAAIGDCIILEPVMRYYALKGYNVVLDIPAAYFELYNAHYFPVKHLSQFDKGRINPEKEINIDLAYEVKPRQNYLKSYFEFAGISDYQLTKPQLYPLVDRRTKLFQKYVVLHIDERETPERNVYGVNWKNVQRHLETLGYTVIQIGANRHEPVGLYMNTPSIGFMKFVLAGADLFIGCDSGPSHIAVAHNVPSIIFFGSVCPDYIHADMTNIIPIQGSCEAAYCWHIPGGTSGQKCKFQDSDKYLQCCNVSFEPVIDAINQLQPR